MTSAVSTPLHRLPNVVPFIAFRVFFNLRFYYPVFALLFLDFGLTLSQFAASNLVWAVAIVLLEVPSGALADIVGRKKLVVLAALLMLCEMGVLLVAKPEPGAQLLLLFCLNRLLSGAGEAMASGADEALVYDALQESGQEKRWSEVLEWQTRLSSVAFFVAMLAGAAVYDPDVLNTVAGWFGSDWHFVKQDTLKYPIWLTLGSGVLALFSSLALGSDQVTGASENPWAQVKEVGQRLLASKPLMAVVLGAVLFDQAARTSLTMSSKTYASYGIDEGWFGVIGAVLGLSGAVISGRARKLAEGSTKGRVFQLLVALSLVGLLGQAASGTPLGLGFVFLLSVVMSLIGFFSSYYLNQLANSRERATLLSFKGLLCNLGFGLISLYYSAVSAVWIKKGGAEEYLHSLFSLPAYFLVALIVYIAWYRLSTPRSHR